MVVACVGCDQVTKEIAAALFRGAPGVSYLGDTLRLSYAENPGGFLSLGAQLSEPLRWWLFNGVTAAIVVALLVTAARGEALGRAQLVGMALVIAGGVGNLIDRTALGVVRDFLNVGIGPLRTGIFNVADLAITTGVVLLLAMSTHAPDHS